MRTEQEIRELCDKSKDGTKLMNELFGIPTKRINEIAVLIDKRMNDKHLVFEDIVWILNNKDFTDDERIFALIERGARFGVFVQSLSPQYIKCHSTLEGALSDPD
jgi:hypothetical protein